MFIRPLILSIAAVLFAGALGAQDSNAVLAVALGPRIVERGSSDTVTVNFDLKPLVHGPYTLALLNLNSQGATIRLNGTEIFRPDEFRIFEISKPVTLNSSNTLEVTFNNDNPRSSLIVSIAGWEYKYANAYPATALDTGVTEPDNEPSGSVDWRTKGVVTPVKNEGTSCPASWAFSTTGAVEGYTAIIGRGLRSLSEQQILDCSGAKSCTRGNTDMAFNYVLDSGLTSEADYPYTAVLGSCKSSTAVSSIPSFERVPIGNENALLEEVNLEPVSVVLNGYWFSSYTGGVATPDCESHVPVFASALIVGYGYDSTSGLDYWLVKNSLGVSWGEQGYFRIVRNLNACGIADYALQVN